MMPTYFSVGILLAIVGFCSGLNAGYFNCPDDTKAVVEVGDVQKEVPGIIGVETLDVRVPESGLLTQQISCVIVTDLSEDGAGGTVALIGGGLGSKYIELKLTSGWFRGMKYRIQVYTDTPSKTTTTTTTKKP